MAWPSPNEIGLPTPVPQTRDLQQFFEEQLSITDGDYSSHEPDICQQIVFPEILENKTNNSQNSNVIHYAASQGFVEMLRKMLNSNPNEIEFLDSVSLKFFFKNILY